MAQPLIIMRLRNRMMRGVRLPGVLKSPLLNFILLILCFALIIGLGGYVYAQSLIRYERQQRREQEQYSTRIAAQALRERLRVAVEDIAFIKSLTLFSRVLETDLPEESQRLAGQLKSYMRAHQGIAQVRCIDNNGREKLRVDYVNGALHLAPEAALQDKSSHAYVIKASTLPVGGIYLSPLNLNIEHNEIETPYVPTIRLSVPLFDLAGARRGLVVVNFFGRQWINALKEAAGEQADRLMLVNREGYWLSSPQVHDEWGFQLGRQTTMNRRYPSAWDAIGKKRAGAILLEDRLWTWATVDPIAVVRSSVQSLAGPDTNPTIATDSHYRWHIVLQLSQVDMALINTHVWRSLAPILGLILLLTAALSAWVTRAQRKIILLNRDLAERAEAAEAASRAKADFVANMSHEIRTPMNAVAGLAYLLKQQDLPDEAHQIVHRIRGATRSLKGIIDDILDFSKIDADRIIINISPFSLAEVLDNLSTIMAANAVDKSIELVIAPPPAPIDLLDGDAQRLEQVLINLASNAIKFTDQGYVELAVRIMAMSETEVSLRFAVRDTGIGIAETAQEAIFTQFSQADSSTTRRFGGTGLGLTICRRLVELMGGKIGVISQPGAGSEFWFTLTFARGKPPAPACPDLMHLDVIIADDNAVARAGLQDTAVALGWAATTVDSGEQLLRHVFSHRAERSTRLVIVLDWDMPGMSNLETIDALRGADQDNPEPIIVMVAATSRRNVVKHLDPSRTETVVDKPVTPSSLYNAVAQAIHIRQGSLPVGGVGHAPRLAGLNMLIVDDNDINRDIAERIFSREGAQVALADDGQQAVNWMQRHGHMLDIVLMDIQMPVLDGYQATRQIRQLPGGAELPIVALTAGTLTQEKDAARAAGMNDFIAKPFDVDRAIELIQKLTAWTAPESTRTDKAAVAPPASQTDAEREDLLPGIAVERALGLWQDASVYRRYLRRFAHEHRDTARKMAQMSRGETIATAHALAGTAGNLGLDDVHAQAARLERTLRADSDASTALTSLQAALDTALSSIARYAPDTVASGDHTNTLEDMNTAEVERVLNQLLVALDSNDPDAVEPWLNELAGHLPRERLAPVQIALDNFDFAAGRAAIRSLGRELDMPLGDSR